MSSDTTAITYSERFEYHDDSGNSHKFWEYEYNGYPTFSLTTRWGRIGTKGSSKIFPGFVQSHEVDERVGEKERKGYKRVSMNRSTNLEATEGSNVGAPRKLVTEHDPKLSLVDRMECIFANRYSESVPGYTLVHSYEWTKYGCGEYIKTVEITPIPYHSFSGPKKHVNKLIESVDGLVISWEEAKRMMTLLNGTSITSGDPGSYAGEFRSIRKSGTSSIKGCYLKIVVG